MDEIETAPAPELESIAGHLNHLTGHDCAVEGNVIIVKTEPPITVEL